MHDILKRWRGGTATALRSAGALIAIGSVAFVAVTVAPNAFGAANGVMLQIKDAPLKDVVMLLTQQSGTNIVISGDANLDRKVTANLTDVSLEKALDYVVKSAGVSYRKMSDGTYIIGGVDDSQPVDAPRDLPSALTPVQQVADPTPKPVIITKIPLTHTMPSVLLRLISDETAGSRGYSSGMEYPDGMRPAGPNNTQRNVPSGVYLNDNNGQTYDLSNGVHMQNNQPVVPTIDPTSLNPGAGRTADSNTGAAQYPYSGGTRSGYTPGNTPGGTSRSTAPGAAASTANQNFLWPEGIQDARPFDTDNSILVKGDEDGIEKFKKIVRMLDVPPKQVQIKCEFVEVTTSDVKNFGIDWSLQRLNESFNTAFGPAGNVIVGLAAGNLTAQLKAQLTRDVGRVINAPIISTINNQSAYLMIQTIIPYWVSVATVVGTGNVVQQSTPQFLQVQTELMVMPRVNGDGTITLQLSPQIADTGSNVTGPDGTVIPEQTSQSLYAQRRVANGETVVVGGFIRKNDSTSIQKIPILGDLPIVGSLFRTTAKTLQESELLIFVTPTIIPDPTGGTVGTSLVP